ncbi:hypothetical protein JW992_08180 [candidate division KSB1 bacterium]|nr:hypothetical protein [candidate division KSB1 bacterium]
MKTRLRYSVLAILLLLVAGTGPAFAQNSGANFRRYAIMRGNLVKTVFGNWGVIGQPAERGSRGAWIYDNNGYVGDVSLLVGAEVESDGQTFHSVVICPVNRPTSQHENQSGKYWAFEPVAGYFNPNALGLPLYSAPETWPTFWPDKLQDPLDPGWRGSWNGFFGKSTTASEECYFVMDDNNDEEFNHVANNDLNVAFKPDDNNPNRNGLGLEVKVRGMQWNDFLAQDCIFWLYEITNTGTTDYSKVTFGMLVGTYVGVTSTEDYGEYNDDYSFFDVERDLTYTADFDNNARRNPFWTGDVGVVGYAFLESPGNAVDGIDNDGDSNDNFDVISTAPLFTAADFQPRLLNAGSFVVLIDRDYNRTVVEVPATPFVYETRRNQGSMAQIQVIPGVTQLVEGNVVIRDGQEEVNPNAYDGIDNDLDGLIDENFYLHYRQVRRDTRGNILIDKLSPVRYKDYINGIGLDDTMIDEARDDGIDNDNDWNLEFDDVGADGLIGTNDIGEGDGIPTPGEPNFDQTDIDESDQIGLTSFEYFTPASEFAFADDEDLWRRLSPGFFKVPESIVNNKPQRGEDGDFIYGSGYFPLRAGETQRLSLALVYGEGGGPQVDIADLLDNRETVQNIYNNDYRFPPAPNVPTVWAEAGDGKVTLYWDRRAEYSFDPVLKEFDFEGYKIYKATDHNFNDVFSVTDADGGVIAYDPLAQYDLKNGISGYFTPPRELMQTVRGASFNLGKDTGLVHSFVDEDVENGRRYFYAVVAYDRGSEEKLIMPKETNKRILVDSDGTITTFRNTVLVVPNDEVAGYAPPPGSVPLEAEETVGTGSVFYKVIDESAQTAHNYRLEFWDTGNDDIDNDEDGLVDTEDASEYFVPVTYAYGVRDLSGVSENFVAQDTFLVRLGHENLVAETVQVYDQNGDLIPSERYLLDAKIGNIRGRNHADFLYGATYSIRYQYYPIFKSPYIAGSPFAAESKDSDNFDGIQMVFNNNWRIEVNRQASQWSNPTKALSYTMNIIDTQIGSSRLLGLRHPSDYRIEFYDEVVDSSLSIPSLYVFGLPVNFKIYNITDQRPIDFVFNDFDFNQMLSKNDELIFSEPGLDGEAIYTWDLLFTLTQDTVYTYGMGDTLTLRLSKPFRRGDSFEFTTQKAEVDRQLAVEELENIRVVPNPYISATAHETPLPPAINVGRGERKIDFIHLPAGAQIYIFTARGEHVITLDHGIDMFDGTVSWNLKSKENLDVAAGVYLYVVKSSVGEKTGKIAIIK